MHTCTYRFFRICGINKIRFASIFLRCRISRVRFASIFFFKVWLVTYIQSSNHIHTYIRRVLSHLLIAWQLSGTDLPVVPSRESNSGLPSSKPTRYQLSHAAPKLSHAAPQLSHAASIFTSSRISRFVLLRYRKRSQDRSFVPPSFRYRCHYYHK